MNFNSKNLLWACAVLLVISAWIYGLFVDLTGDSGLYAAISRQMVESGDWINLKINEHPYDQKPHLLFWLAGLGIKLFGNTNFAFKLFPFLFGLSSIYFTYRLGRLFFNSTAGRLAALFTGTSQLYFLYFMDIHTDTMLQSAVILSLWQLAEYMEHRKPLNFILGFAGIGLAMLTKGPVGAILPFFFILFYLMLKKDFRQLFHIKWLAGIALIILIISPTLYHLWKSFGVEGLRFYFIDNNLGRVSGEVAGSSTDLFFYTYNLLWAFLPWTLPVIAGLILEVKSWFTGHKVHLPGASLFGSVLVLLVVYSIARGKAPNYFMMLMPPMAVIAGGQIQNLLGVPLISKKRLLWIHGVILSLIMILLILIWFFITPLEHPARLIVLVAVVAILSLLFFRAEHSMYNRIMFVSVIVIASFNLLLNTIILPVLFKYQGAPQVIEVYEKTKMPGEELFVFEMEEYELYFYARNLNVVKIGRAHV